MGRGTEQAIFQRQTNGKQVHKKLLDITNHKGNANQNHNEISLHICQNGYYKKRQQIRNIVKGVGKREHKCTVGGNVNLYNHYAKQNGGSLRN